MLFKMNSKIGKSRIDITPLVDVVFQLIIFFMLSSSFILQPGIKVDLPSTHSTKAEKTSGMSVIIRSDGRIFLEDHEVRKSQLKQALFEEKRKRTSDFLVIKADQRARHGLVVEVMAIAKEVGISRIAIATKPIILEKEEQ